MPVGSWAPAFRAAVLAVSVLAAALGLGGPTRCMAWSPRSTTRTRRCSTPRGSRACACSWPVARPHARSAPFSPRPRTAWVSWSWTWCPARRRRPRTCGAAPHRERWRWRRPRSRSTARVADLSGVASPRSVAPDVVVDDAPLALAEGRDAVLEAALELLTDPR
jgi:hypothetical protein